jgi:hypothetical protein
MDFENGGSIAQMSGVGSEVNLFATEGGILGTRTPSGTDLDDDDDDFMNGDNITKKKDEIDAVDEDKFKKELEDADDENGLGLRDTMTVQ